MAVPIMREFVLVNLLLLCLMGPTGLRAETYLGGHFGVMLPQKNGGDTEVTTPAIAAGTRSSNVNFDNSYIYGMRLGHYFDPIPWFGIETEAFYATPHLQQGNLRAYPPGAGPSPLVAIRGESMRLIAWANSLMFRVVDERFKLRPYTGIGIGLFSARLHEAVTDESRTSTKPGVNAKFGTSYFLSPHVSMFGEYRFNYVRFEFDRTASLPGISANFIAHTFAVGVNYHF